ncbi:hypothetical protein ACHQM5_016077 [Ranunculus cassubicifolius]
MKERIKEWNINHFGVLETRIREGLQSIKELDKKEERELNEEEREKREKGRRVVGELLKLEEKKWRQKSREMEVKEGELNTKYFQTIANARARMNSVSKLMIEGELVEDGKKIEKHVAGFFKNLYKEPKHWRPRLEGLDFKKIAEEEKDRLEEVILEKEVKEAIDGLGGEKAPGPDGFPIIFFKKCWDFMKGRQIIDCCLVANELIDSKRKQGGGGMAVKIDMMKAYDHVSWNFLEWVMIKMGFGSKWRRWIRICISNARFSILLNGSSKKFFKSTRGLRQGDPLSPFLFIMVTEVLSMVTSLLVSQGELDGFKASNAEDGVVVSHLQFADDTMFFLSASVEKARVLRGVLLWFEVASGLKINMKKSKVYGVGVSEEVISEVASILECGVEVFPSTYLGLPLGAKSKSINIWCKVIERVDVLVGGRQSTLLREGDSLFSKPL